MIGPILNWIIGLVASRIGERLQINGAKLVVKFDDKIRQAAWDKSSIGLEEVDKNPQSTEEERKRALEQAKKDFDDHHSWHRA